MHGNYHVRTRVDPASTGGRLPDCPAEQDRQSAGRQRNPCSLRFRSQRKPFRLLGRVDGVRWRRICAQGWKALPTLCCLPLASIRGRCPLMSRIYRSLPPRAPSWGSLFPEPSNTRTAVAWLSRRGMQMHAYTADLAQPDEKNPAPIFLPSPRHTAREKRVWSIAAKPSRAKE